MVLWMSVLAMLAPSVQAASQVRLAGWKVVMQDWREQLHPLGMVQPGDRVEYQATYANEDTGVARAVQLTLPIPPHGLVWQPVDATPEAPAPTHASLDGEHFAPVPLLREQQLPDGRRVMRRVPLSEYRFLRWHLGDVPAGASRTVRARMQWPATLVPTTQAAR